MMVVDAEFKLRDMVFLKTDPDQCERMVTGICVREDGISYELGCGSNSSWNYGFEISEEKNIVKTT